MNTMNHRFMKCAVCAALAAMFLFMFAGCTAVTNGKYVKTDKKENSKAAVVSELDPEKYDILIAIIIKNTASVPIRGIITVTTTGNFGIGSKSNTLDYAIDGGDTQSLEIRIRIAETQEKAEKTTYKTSISEFQKFSQFT